MKTGFVVLVSFLLVGCASIENCENHPELEKIAYVIPRSVGFQRNETVTIKGATLVLMKIKKTIYGEDTHAPSSTILKQEFFSDGSIRARWKSTNRSEILIIRANGYNEEVVPADCIVNGTALGNHALHGDRQFKKKSVANFGRCGLIDLFKTLIGMGFSMLCTGTDNLKRSPLRILEDAV